MTNEEILNRIIAKLKEKVGDTTPTCPLCKKDRMRELGGRYVVLPLSKLPTQVTLGGQVYPMVALVCPNCGHTALINLLTLGFTSSDLESMGMDDNG